MATGRRLIARDPLCGGSCLLATFVRQMQSGRPSGENLARSRRAAVPDEERDR